MTLEELKKEISILTASYEESKKQINALELVSLKVTIETNGKEEQLVHYDYETIFREYIELEKKLLFFVNNYLNEFYKMITNSFLEKGEGFYPLNNQIYSYYFDSVLAAISTMIELEQRDELLKYFNKNKLLSFFPDKNEIGFWWEVYMLRNRIHHHTSKRYSSNNTSCQCYMPFNSRVNCVQLDKDNNITLETTLLDIYKVENIEKAIKVSLKTRKNPFDILFPYTSAKGKNKRNPSMLYISNDIHFDYATSGIRFMKELFSFIKKINNLFYEELLSRSKDKESLKEIETLMYIEGQEFKYKVNDVFNDN